MVAAVEADPAHAQLIAALEGMTLAPGQDLRTPSTETAAHANGADAAAAAPRIRAAAAYSAVADVELEEDVVLEAEIEALAASCQGGHDVLDGVDDGDWL